MKKLVLFVMLLSMLVSLCACGNSESAAAPAAPETTPPAAAPAQPVPETEPEAVEEPERKVYDHSLWVIDDAEMLSAEEYESVVDMVESWYMDYGYKIGIAMTAAVPSEPEFQGKSTDLISSLQSAMEVGDSEPFYTIVFSSDMSNGMNATGWGMIAQVVQFVDFADYTSTPHDAMLEYISNMDKCFDEIDFNDVIEIVLPEMDGSEPTVSSAEAMDRIMELDAWNEPQINKTMEYDPATGVWSESDKINVYLSTKAPDENSEAGGITLSYDENSGSIYINVSEQDPAFKSLDKHGNPMSDELAANGGLDENGVYAGVSGYGYGSRQLLKEIFSIALPGAGEEPYELLKAVFHGEAYEMSSCNPSVTRWIDGHYFSIELNTTYNTMNITIGLDGDTALYETFVSHERLNYERVYEGVFGADKFVAAYELDRW